MKTTNEIRTYAIKHSYGQTETGIGTYEEAVSRVRSVYPNAEIGHSGDISEGGERTLCWIDEETSKNDDGSRACCSIQVGHSL